jgi:hypothetical protein
MGSKKDQDAIDEAIAMAMDSMYEDKIMLPDEPDMGVKNKRGDSSRFMRSEKAKDRALERRARDSASRTIDGFMGGGMVNATVRPMGMMGGGNVGYTHGGKVDGCSSIQMSGRKSGKTY